MSVNFSLQTADGNFACTADHGICTVPEHLLDEDIAAYSMPGYCVECSLIGREECPICGLEVNVSNTNATLLLERLGVENDDCGTFDPVDLVGRTLVANVGRDDSGVATSTDIAANGAVWVDFGLRDGYFRDQMARLTTLALTAKENGWLVTWS